MKIKLSGTIEVQTTEEKEEILIKKLTFPNPKHQEALKFNRSTFGIASEINLTAYINETLTVPIGLLNYLKKKFNPVIIDQRKSVSANISFTGTLRPYQERFIYNAIQSKGGQMIAATGSGKTVSGIALASLLEQRTLILVKSKDLAKQWKDAIKTFTGLDAGLIGGGKNTEGEQFTIGLTQTLCKRDCSLLNYGLVIADECHNLPANQAYKVMNTLNAKYKYGLSATPQRRDNMEFMIFGAIGAICSEINQKELDGKVLPVHISKCDVPFDTEVDSWAGFLTALVDNEARNQLIVNRAIKVSEKMGTIILCAQVRHCEMLGSYCRDEGTKALVLHGQLPAKERLVRMEQAPDAPLIIGTLSLLSEGIDLPHLAALIFASPVSASIERSNPAATRLIQSIGRCRRPYGKKTKAFVLDIVDQCGFGVSAWNKRHTIYQQKGYKVS